MGKLSEMGRKRGSLGWERGLPGLPIGPVLAKGESRPFVFGFGK